MADNSFDCTASNLLCPEGKEGLSFDDFETVAEVTDEKNPQSNDKDLSFGVGRSEPFITLPCLTEEKFRLMVDKERDHLPKDDYLKRLRVGDLDMGVRREALDWILKAYAHYGFGESAFCLSMNYLDRFLSVYELPRGKTWTVQLLAVTCLSLAAKMEEIKVPLTVDLQVGEPKFVFEGKTIQRMELLVLSTLKWKMSACTPYSFIDYFLRKINDDHDQDQLFFGTLIARSIKLILSTIKGIDFLEFRPSEIAAAVAIYVAATKTQEEAIDVDKAMSCFIPVEKGRVLKCLELIKDLTLVSEGSTTTTNVGNASVPAVPHSPNGVLEAACLSYKSDERTVGSCPSSSQNSPDNKRKKLDTTATSSSSSSSLGNSLHQKS